jgi:hypothetical protein
MSGEATNASPDPFSSAASVVSSIAVLDNMFGSTGEHAARKHDWDMFDAQKTYNTWQAKLNRRFNANQAEIARESAQKFSRNMSNTAVQRRMRDMRKAGINPLLASKYDASTPAGAAVSASGSNANSPSTFAARPIGKMRSEMMIGAGNLATNALNAKTNAFMAQEKAKEIESNIDKNVATIKNLEISRKYTEAQINRVGAEISLIQEQIQYELEKTKGQKYANVAMEVYSEWLRKNPSAAISQNFGVDGKDMLDMVQSVIFAAVGYRLFGAQMKGLTKLKNQKLSKQLQQQIDKWGLN